MFSLLLDCKWTAVVNGQHLPKIKFEESFDGGNFGHLSSFKGSHKTFGVYQMVSVYSHFIGQINWNIQTVYSNIFTLDSISLLSRSMNQWKRDLISK